MSDGFRCDDGWYDIIYELFERLEPLVAKLDESGPSFEVVQVKEKFATLRFYVNRRNDEINAAIVSACGRSRRTCEICGNPGNLEERLRKTLCPTCKVSHIIAMFDVAAKRSRRITDYKLHQNRLLWLREKLQEASESLSTGDKEKVLKANADSFSAADYRPVASESTPFKDRSEAGAMAHVVLLGDSIFDNLRYVHPEPDVVAQLQELLPPGWKTSLRAVDGAVTDDVAGQLTGLPA